jgi:hypothetical protein
MTQKGALTWFCARVIQNAFISFKSLSALPGAILMPFLWVIRVAIDVLGDLLFAFDGGLMSLNFVKPLFS